MDIIYEDKDMIVLNKAAGKLTQSGKSFDIDLVSEVCTYRRKKGEEPYAAVINRLDRPVSGIVLMAKNKKTAAKFSRYMQQESLCKKYMAVITGELDRQEGILEDYLVKDGKNNISSVVSKKAAEGGDVHNAKLARLKYSVEKTFTDEGGRKCSLVNIELLTGRHHQIRVQFASRKHPLVGDVKYGDDKNAVMTSGIVKNGQIALCAVSLTIENKEYKVVPDWIN